MRNDQYGKWYSVGYLKNSDAKINQHIPQFKWYNNLKDFINNCSKIIAEPDLDFLVIVAKYNDNNIWKIRVEAKPTRWWIQVETGNDLFSSWCKKNNLKDTVNNIVSKLDKQVCEA